MNHRVGSVQIPPARYRLFLTSTASPRLYNATTLPSIRHPSPPPCPNQRRNHSNNPPPLSPAHCPSMAPWNQLPSVRAKAKVQRCCTSPPTPCGPGVVSSPHLPLSTRRVPKVRRSYTGYFHLQMALTDCVTAPDLPSPPEYLHRPT